MKIEELFISGIGGIKELKVEFSPDMNIICGPNGIGKSTILLAASYPFLHGTSLKVRKNINSEKGVITAIVYDAAKRYETKDVINTSLPTEWISTYNQPGFNKRKVIKFDTMRYVDYQQLGSINVDRSLSDDDVSQQLNSGITLENIKEWFAKRSLFEKVDNGYSENTLTNLNLSKKCISILNPDFKFSRVDPKTFDIFVNTPAGEIWYEYLSSGFKSCMSLMLGIIKEIEFRFPDKDMLASNFDGIILIDELELHLHPEWQAKITGALTTTFPSAQFIVTTHSPHVVQNAKPYQIIALEQAEDGQASVRSQPGKESGYTGWTVDEVLRDVMGMESTLSRELQQTLGEFYNYIDEEDHVKASALYAYLDTILHPKNVLRKSLTMSLDMIESGGEEA
ncbi:AAA family ATPase [Pantoea agglomerans]